MLREELGLPKGHRWPEAHNTLVIPPHIQSLLALKYLVSKKRALLKCQKEFFEGAWSYGSEFKNIWPLFRYFPLGETYRRLIYICGCRSVTKSCPTLCDPMNHSTPGFPVIYCLLEFAQTLVRGISDAIQPSHPLSLPSPPAFSLSQHQGLFQWVGSSHQVVKVLELQLQHQSFQWIFRVDFL